MRLNGDGNIRPVVVGKRKPPRVQVRAGPLRLTFTVSEAIALADAIVDAAERIEHPPKERTP
ncbi:hypothetical protein ACAG24_026265 [Mycobacterium sp. pW049]|uniref:hypothetical protein n=1 Tax=[Mycobacterium] bulgaricum TaxID=3238985 RepID=UPI00351BCA9C